MTKGGGATSTVPATTGTKSPATTGPGSGPSTTTATATTSPGDVTVFGRSGTPSVRHLAVAPEKPPSKQRWVWLVVGLVVIGVLGAGAALRTRLTKSG